MVTGPALDVIYDNECFWNFFSCGVTPLAEHDNTQWIYEISERRNDGPLLVQILRGGYFRRMYGFNNLGYDYPLLHKLAALVDHGADAATINRTLKELSQAIIEWRGPPWEFRVNYKAEMVKQVDMRLIHHFDNPARMTSLKTLEFNMRARRVQDLPFPHDTILTPAQMDVIRDYNGNDIFETKRFVRFSLPMIEFREQLGIKHLNDNDTKIGKSFFISALEKRSPGSCYDENRKPRQTWRHTVPLADVIFPWIKFDRPEATAVLETLKATTLRADEIETAERGAAKVATKGIFKNLNAMIDGFQFVFGVGGIHGSVTNEIVKADATHEIADVDVESYYPSIAIENGVYPEHLGPVFVEVYRELKARRALAKQLRNMVESDALKLANNGVYGDSNNMHGPFYDPKYTMTITVNGQLMLVMLGEAFTRIPGLKIIQANTDGMTVRFPRAHRAWFDAICTWWQSGTCMKLEEKQYEAMWIRDCNNYIGRYSMDAINKGDVGKYKRKGAYDFELKVGDQKAWHKDHSSLVVQRAANAALCEDICPEDFIRNHEDPWDFMIRAKVTGQSRLVLADGTECQKTTRYYVAHDGKPMFKIMPPLAKNPTHWRKSSIHAKGQATRHGPKGAYQCSICGDQGQRFQHIYQFDEHNDEHHGFKVKITDVFDGGSLPGLNTDYYLQETLKLLDMK